MGIESGLKPWAIRAFELIHHAEVHYRKDTDYDRRLALISFDNSIEVSITTYLSLDPIQRNKRSYAKEDVKKWLVNFHSKIDFFALEIQRRGLPEYKEKADIIWYHGQRNGHYHGSASGVPEKKMLDEIRQVALWVFSVLFETADVESRLEASLSQSEEGLPAIPVDFVVPREPKSAESILDPTQGKALSIAALIGRWEESNEADREIIGKLAHGL